ncbi:unnamed protein product [Blepharisma stoltei]|uniref:TmcB/TmcC TPR repeats domain-containing protein n=1 Tax=Blepharisma stoltei TaxID=1481888 RepID=A0AAU9IS96_9CILI|nr:unnamed protein product [Blepharisma stoltei]
MFLGVFLLVYITYHSYSIQKLFLLIFKRIFDVWAIFFMVPSMTLFSIFLKYNFLPKDHIWEYRTHNEFANFEINIYWEVAIIFAMILSFPLLLCYANFSGEIRHSISKKVINARAHSKINIQIALFTWFLPIFYAILAEDYIIYFQLSILTISILLSIETLILLPYFSIYCNCVQLLRLSFIALVSFSFIFGYALDNSLVISFLAIILGLSSIKITIFLTRKFYSKIKPEIPTNLSEINSEYDLEKSLRFVLCSSDNEHKDQIIQIFQSFFIKNYTLRSRLQAIWIANYCIFALKDESLAKIKLSQVKKVSDWSLEGKYQEYLCNKNILEINKSECEQFINYLQHLNWIKKEDKTLCWNLLTFWEEITSLTPDLPKIIQGLGYIHHEISYLNTAYHQLTTKFFKSRESIALYATYLKNIYFDMEKSVLLEAKLRSFDKIAGNAAYDYSNFSYFSGVNGILISSAEEDDFGEIFFANKKFGEVVQCPLHSIIGNNLLNFLPSIYHTKIKENANYVSNFGSSSEIDLTEGLFLISPANILTECTAICYLTSINNFLVTSMTFKPILANHEIALIMENGEIFCHSINFFKPCRTCYDLQGLFIKNLFSDLESIDLQDFVPYPVPAFQKGAYVVQAYKDYHVFKIYYLLLINDPKEILKWKGFIHHSSHEEDLSKSNEMEISLFKAFEDEEINIADHNIYDTETNLDPHKDSISHNSLDAIENFLSEKIEDEKSIISQGSPKYRFFKMIGISSRSINILHIAFIISILSVIATNIGVLFYAIYNVDYVSNMDLPVAVGKTAKLLQATGFIAHTIFLVASSGTPFAAQIVKIMTPGLAGKVMSVESLYLNITQELDKWDYCSGLSTFTDEHISIWEIEGEPYKKKSNLLNAISQFIRYGNAILQKLNSSEDISKEVSFVELNGFGEAFQFSNQSMYDIISCQKDIMDDFKTKMLIFLILGVAVLAICVCCMIPFCYSTIKIENNLWNNIRDKTFNCYFELTQLSIERLTTVHYEPEIMLDNARPTKKKYKFNIYWKYLWRISLYFLLVSTFSIINITYFYEKCTDYLSKRPEIIRDLINGQIVYTGLGVWTIKAFSDNMLLASNALVNIIPFSNSESVWQETITKISLFKTHLRQPKYSSILSDDFKNEYFENGNVALSDVFIYGKNTGQNILEFDSYFIVYSYPGFQLWLNWLITLGKSSDSFDVLTDEIDKYSQSKIDDQMNIIFIVLVVFIIISIFMYLGLYLRFFKREKKYLQKINSVMRIMPH